MIEILGTTYYITEMTQWVYFIFYFLPTSIIFIVIAIKLKPKRVVGRAVLGMLSLMVITLPVWDVIVIGQEASQLCKEESGLHAYKTAEADGFLGASAIKKWSKYGFLYIENITRGRAYRYSMEGSVPLSAQIQIEKLISKFTIARSSESVAHQIERHATMVKNRKSTDILGELIYFMIYPGLFDSFILSVTPTTFTPWTCGREHPSYPSEKLGYDDVVRATLTPTQ